MWMDLLFVILCIAAISIFILTSLFIFFRYIYLEFKHKSKELTADELLGILSSIIEMQLGVYDKNVFNKKRSLDNASFENYYQELTREIWENLSDDFLYRIKFYFKEELIISIIAKTVRQYLVEKTNILK